MILITRTFKYIHIDRHTNTQAHTHTHIQINQIHISSFLDKSIEVGNNVLPSTRAYTRYDELLNRRRSIIIPKQKMLLNYIEQLFFSVALGVVLYCSQIVLLPFSQFINYIFGNRVGSSFLKVTIFNA